MNNDLAVNNKMLQTLSEEQKTKIIHALVNGDVKSLNPDERVIHYKILCETSGLNPFTQPFSYIPMQGKLTVYANKECSNQLRKINNVSLSIVSREKIDDLYIVTARATLPDGRHDESIAAVSLTILKDEKLISLKGEALANALMKCETKVKRRVTLSACGLGMLDETEVETIPNAKPVKFNYETGEILEGEVIQSCPPPIKKMEEEKAPQTPVEKITPEQAQDLDTMFTILGKNCQPYFARKNITCWNDLPLEDFEKLYTYLNEEITRKENAKGEAK